MPHANSIGLDVGSRRIGVALSREGVRLASPLTTLQVDGTEIDRICELVVAHQAACIVIGYPRNQSGDPTAQSRDVEEFATRLEARVSVPLHFQDESLTSVLAEDQLKAQKKQYRKEDIDARAAALILQDYIEIV